MSTVPLSCHENPICLILPIGQQLPNYHKVLQLYKYGIKEIESCLQNLKEGQECVENICDLIIILCQSASGNATRVLSHAICLFSFELSGTLTSHPPSPYSLTSLKSSSMSTRLHQKKTLFILFLILYFANRNKLLNANFKRNLLCRQWCCIPIYVFAFTVLSPSD